MSGEEPFARFQEFCEQFPGLWNSLDIRVASVRVQDREVVLHLAIHLDPRAPDEIRPSPYDPSVEGYKVDHAAIPYAELASILDGLREGVLKLGKRRISIESAGSGGATDVHWSLMKHTGGRYEAEVASAELRASGGDNLATLTGDHDFESEIEHRWRSLPAPYMGETDVLSSYFGIMNVGPRRVSTCLQVRATVPVRLDERVTMFADDGLIIGVRAPVATAHQDIQVGVVADSGRRRFSLALSGIEPERAEDQYLYRIMDPANGVAHVVLYLQYREVQVDELSLWNARGLPLDALAEVHQYFDPDRSVLHRMLFGVGSKKPRQNFDKAVAWLLGLCGIQPMVYDGTGVQDEVDLVAYVPEHNTLVCVECTVSGPAKEDKLDKLHQRCREVEAITNASVQPVLATAWEQRLLHKDIREAARIRGVALLAKEQLQRLEELGLLRVPTRRVLEFLRDSIPREPSAWDNVLWKP